VTFELPSRAEGCQGRPPIVAHPELLQPRHPFQPEHELALFDLKRVDAYLATFTWERLVGKTGQITLGGRHERYTVGRAYKGQQVLVRFDPPTVTLSFTRWMSREGDRSASSPALGRLGLDRSGGLAGRPRPTAVGPAALSPPRVSC